MRSHHPLLRSLLSLCVVCALFSCASSPSTQEPQPGVLVTRESMGEAWPLTVAQARVECLDGRVAVVHANGVTYALNGTATARGYPAIDPIWRPNPLIPGTKVNIGPLIDIALKQCK